MLKTLWSCFVSVSRWVLFFGGSGMLRTRWSPNDSSSHGPFLLILIVVFSGVAIFLFRCIFCWGDGGLVVGRLGVRWGHLICFLGCVLVIQCFLLSLVSKWCRNLA